MPLPHRLRQHFLNVTEPVRLVRDYADFRKERQNLLDETPDGDGHPVLVLPGFGGDDKFDGPLIKLLNEKGYNAYGWDNGHNTRLNEDNARQIAEHLRNISRGHGDQPVTIICHSLGGFIGHTLAQELPQLVRDVYTAGTPFGISAFPEATPKFLVNLIQALSSERFSLKAPDVLRRLLTPPKDIPVISFFSKKDGVTDYRACLHPDKDRKTGEKLPTANHEINASHTGLLWHPDTVRLMLHYLAQPEGGFKKHPSASTETPPPSANWQPPAGEKWRFYPKLKI